MESGLVFDVRNDTKDNGGGKVSEDRYLARHRIVPYTSICKNLSSACQRADLSHVRPTIYTLPLLLFATGAGRAYRAGQLPRWPQVCGDDHANEERYCGAWELKMPPEKRS